MSAPTDVAATQVSENMLSFAVIWRTELNKLACTIEMLSNVTSRRVLRRWLLRQRLSVVAVSRCVGSYDVMVVTCSEFAGWAGASCSEFDCGGVNDCYGNGECIGPNTCQCTEGWSGASCVIASCRSVQARVGWSLKSACLMYENDTKKILFYRYSYMFVSAM